MVEVWHYDGITGARQTVTLDVADNGFALETGEGREEHRWTDLFARARRGGSRVFGLHGRTGWQIGFDGEIPADIATVLPREPRFGGLIDRVGLLPMSGVFAALSACAVFGAVRGSEWVAPRIPLAWERQLSGSGDQLASRQCRSPAGQAALTALNRRLSDKTEGVTVTIVDLPLINAVALPGGRVVVFDGLLKQAQSPDELAGVIAHELGHIAHRDVAQGLVRQLALRMVLGGMSGDMSSGMNAMLSARYSRDAEADADRYAMDALRRAHVSPRDTAAFFQRLAREDEKHGNDDALGAYVASHPVSDERGRAFAASASPSGGYSAVLDQNAWMALINICPQTPTPKYGS